MSLHPDLERLGQQYDELVAAAEAGHISPADALGTLAGLSVRDADDTLWAINADGEYVRSAYPGAPAEVADPAQFATTAAPVEPYLPGAGPFPATPAPFPAADPGAAAAFPSPPPTFPTTGPGPFPAGPGPFPAGPGPFPAGPFPTTGASPEADPLAAPPAGFNPDAGPGFPSAATPLQVPGHPAPPKNTRSIADADRTGRTDRFGGALRRAQELLVANKVLAGIVGAGLLLLVLLSLQSGHPAPTTQLPTGTPGTGATGTAAPAMPNTPAAPAAPAVPSKAQATDVVSALSSGRRDLVAATMAGAPATKDLARATALWAGAAQTGLHVTPGPASAEGQGAVQTWTVADGRGPVATLTVTWVLAGGHWKLAALPTF